MYIDFIYIEGTHIQHWTSNPIIVIKIYFIFDLLPVPHGFACSKNHEKHIKNINLSTSIKSLFSFTIYDFLWPNWRTSTADNFLNDSPQKICIGT